jgi:hypothetical protein
MTIREQARDLVCELERFLTPERWTKGDYARNLENDQTLDFLPDTIDNSAGVKFCELGALAYIFYDLHGVWIDPDSISTTVKVWNKNQQEYLTAEDHCHYDEYWPLDDEQEAGIKLAYRTLVEQGCAMRPDLEAQAREKYGTFVAVGIPVFNDDEATTHEHIATLNAAACAVLRDTPTCEKE